MASPQPDKFTKISNELLDALVKIRIPGEARQVFDYILRRTCGFDKKKDQISLSQFVEATTLNKRSVERAIKRLKNMKLIIVYKKTEKCTPIYYIQKNYKLWITKKLTTPK